MTISATTPARALVLLTTVAVVLVLLLATGVAASVGAPVPHSAVASASADATTGYVTYRVTPGDTLWDIATTYTAPEDDVRRTVYEIKAANGLEGSIITVGQVLRIPVRD